MILNNDTQSDQIVLKRSIHAVRSTILFSIISMILLIVLSSIAQTFGLFQWFILLSLLIILVVSIFALRDDEPRIIMDEQGIYARGIGQFAWKSIQEVWPEYYRRVCILVFKMDNGEHIRVNISSLTMLPDDIRYHIEKQIARH